MVKTEASQPARRTVPTNQEIIEIDDDVAILGVENECKLPHARGDCPKHKFQIGSHGVCANHCAQCYCYVCDAPAGDCKSWGAHCVAHAGSSTWQKAREKAKKKQAKQANGPQNGALQSKCGCDQCAILAEWLGASSRPRVLYVRGRADKDCVAASAALEPGCVCYKVADHHGRAAQDLKIVRAAAAATQSLSLRSWTMDVSTTYSGAYYQRLMGYNPFASDDSDEGSDDEVERVTVDRDNVVTVGRVCATCGEQVAARQNKDACEVCGMHRGGRGGCDRRLEPVAGAPLLGQLDIPVEIKADDPRQKCDYQENWAANPGWRYDERAAAEGAFARVFAGSSSTPSSIVGALAKGLKRVEERGHQSYSVDGSLDTEDEADVAELYEAAEEVFTRSSYAGPGALVAKVGAKMKPRRNASDVVARGVVTIAFYVGPEGFKLPAEWSKSGRGKVRQSRQKRVDILAVARALGAADVAKHATGRFRSDDDEALDWVAPDAADGERLVSSRNASAGGWASTDCGLEALSLGALREQQRAFESPRARRAGGSVGGFLGDLENRGHAEHEAEPAGLSVRLLPFQRQSVRWMLDQERLPGGANAHVWAPLAPGLLYSPALNACKRAPAAGDAPGPAGGLLCEEMGMGKTVITAALVLANPAPADRDSQQWADAWAPAATGGKTRARGTLVVCPVSLVGQWVQEATEKMEAAAPRVYRYYGGSRITDPEQLKDFDIVVTTYAVLASDYAGNTKEAKACITSGRRWTPPLERLAWWRVVLDESHTIKGGTTKQSRACCALASPRRWAVTGTPANGSLADLAGQFKFVGVDALDDHAALENVLVRPLQAAGSLDNYEPGYPAGPVSLLRRLVMRHAKAMTYASSARKLLELPPIAENVVDVVFSAEERTAYAALEQQAVAKVRALELEGPAAVRKATFYLHALLRPLRQACSGGAIPTTLPDRGKEAVSAAGDSSGAPIEIDDDDEELGAASAASGPVMRSKLRALISKLVDVRDDDDTAKVLVFSQFNRTLNYLMRELPNYGFDFRCITGSMSMAARSRALADFQQSPPTTIFLLSIRAGACGINLTQANHCIMVEPCTNVALDRQAIGRVHRMGQQRDVTIHRLVLRDSVESRMRDHLYGAEGAAAAAAAAAPAPAPAAGDDAKPDVKANAVIDLAGSGSVRSDNAKLDFDKMKLLFGVGATKAGGGDALPAAAAAAQKRADERAEAVRAEFQRKRAEEAAVPAKKRGAPAARAAPEPAAARRRAAPAAPTPVAPAAAPAAHGHATRRRGPVAPAPAAPAPAAAPLIVRVPYKRRAAEPIAAAKAKAAKARAAKATPVKEAVEAECPATGEVPSRAEPAAPAPAPAAPTYDYAPGDAIEARWNGGTHWHAGTIVAVNPPKTKSRDPTFDVHYDDGDDEPRVPLHLLRAAPKAARAAAGEAAGAPKTKKTRATRAA